MNDLIRRLVAFLAVALQDLRQEVPVLTEGGAATVPRPPLVVAGWLPPKRSTGISDVPCVVVRPWKGEGHVDGSTITVRLLVTTFSESVEGWQDVGNIIQRVETAVRLCPPLGPFCVDTEHLPSWVFYDEQTQPEWAAEIHTTWTQPSAQRTGEAE